MEAAANAIRPPILRPHHLPLRTPKFTALARPCRTPLSHTYRISRSKLKAASSSSAPRPRDFRVSAHFGRRSPRRNSLRKKLEGDQKVRLDNSDYIADSGSRGADAGQLSVENVLPEGEFVNVVDGRRGVGDSALWDKLESWVDQYDKDVELWGIGSARIFTVLKDPDGNVKRVTVNEDEILKRSGIESKNSKDVNLKILRAKSLAREMESGNNVIPSNSSVAKFVVSGKESRFIHAIRELALRPSISPKCSIAGRMALCGLFVVWAVKLMLKLGKQEAKHTQFEKEMVRRKMKSRKEKEILEEGCLEVLPEVADPLDISTERPKLNKEELIRSIKKVSSANGKLVLPDRGTLSKVDKSLGMHDKIEEIREMARRARQIEASEPAQVSDSTGENVIPDDELNDSQIKGNIMMPLINGSHNCVSKEGDVNKQPFLSLEVPVNMGQTEQDVKDMKSETRAAELKEVIKSLNPYDNKLNEETSVRRKPRIILSVKEARDYLSEIAERQASAPEAPVLDSGTYLPCDVVNGDIKDETIIRDNKLLEFCSSSKYDPRANTSFLDDVLAPSSESLPSKDNALETSDEKSRFNHEHTQMGKEINGSATSSKTSPKTENWLEKNYDEFEPIVKRIEAGFRDNYMAAKEKVIQNLDVVSEISQLGVGGDDGELEWMKDDNLLRIVFQVRDNELAGRDPFYSMDPADKRAFFEGLEKKVVRENEKLQSVHEFLHSSIENLDYGADGISLYDPPEKIIPRWKGPPLEKNPEFLESFRKEREAFISGEAGICHSIKEDEESTVQKSAQVSSDQTKPDSSVAINLRNSHSKDSKRPKIVIEGSDGSVRAGKKSGKEYWQHTKRWSRGFLESYNAESDPEVKSVMKDIGKDLDRWITEKEIEEAADLLNKLPEKNKNFIEKKLGKIKREMELFGPQAVVSKYKEYADDKSEDYLWWLDLPHVLCIELYTVQDGEQKVGFYSLEMATDLELEPKPYHVIAFEDASDSKNLCYIIQAHMEMLGNGHAFVVARPPKDAFREAKASGFGVTIIRKGQLQLNVDQTLEEVEEEINEIGSKIYHDAIMKDRSVDISGLMKGVFGVNSRMPRKRRSKQKLKKPS